LGRPKVEYNHPPCEKCGGSVVRRENEKRGNFIRRKFCSRECFGSATVDHNKKRPRVICDPSALRACKDCGESKLPDEFRRSKKGLTCKTCRKAATAVRTKRWSINNRDRKNATVRAYRARKYAKDGRWRSAGAKAKATEEWMAEIKSAPCADCGNRFEACCMDFDHVKGKKLYNVGAMFAHHYSESLIRSELDKCELVCSNCHRIRTRDRRIGSGKYARVQGVSQVV
jgi:hypothetical protein